MSHRPPNMCKDETAADVKLQVCCDMYDESFQFLKSQLAQKNEALPLNSSIECKQRYDQNVQFPGFGFSHISYFSRISPVYLEKCGTSSSVTAFMSYCTLNVIYNIRAISHLLQEITRQRWGGESPTQHVKTCVRFHHRQGHPLLVSPRRSGSVTGSGAGR